MLKQPDHLAAAGALDLDRWSAFPHVVVSGRGRPRDSVDVAPARIGRTRRITAVTPTFLHALERICRTDLIGAFPADVLASTTTAASVSRAVPFAVAPISLHLVRRRRVKWM